MCHVLSHVEVREQFLGVGSHLHVSSGTSKTGHQVRGLLDPLGPFASSGFLLCETGSLAAQTGLELARSQG